LGQKLRDIASDNNCKECECPVKIRYIEDKREVICRVKYPTCDKWCSEVVYVLKRYTMDMEKLFERLVAKMDANQAKAEADRKAD
jgi:hypothetical protein